VRGSARARVVNNTVYQNGGHGIFIGERQRNDPMGSPGAVVMNNLLDGNAGRAIVVTPRSMQDFTTAANLDASLVGPLGFVAPSGSDLLLGGAGFGDDDFRLRQNSAGQASTSVAVDYSIGSAVSVGVDVGSTRTDDQPDDGLADAGFHYSRGADRPAPGGFTPLQLRLAPLNSRRILYVSPNGSGSDGRSPASAYGRIDEAARAAHPGDMIVVAPGRYAEGDISLDNSGTAERPILFVADRSGALSGSAPGSVLIDARGWATGFVLLRRSFVHIRGFHILGAQDAAIQIRACQGDGSECAPQGGSDHVTVADNVLFSSRRGIDVTDSSDATIFNNLIYANDGSGVAITGNVRPAANAQLINNTLYANGGDAIVLSGAAGTPDASLLNNLIQHSSLLGVRASGTSRTTVLLSGNINRDGASPGVMRDPYDPGIDPGFIRPAGLDGGLGGDGFADDDFRLDVTGSPALDAAAMEAADLALAGAVARSDGAVDSGRAELGFHYNLPGPFSGLGASIATLYVRADIGDDANDGRTPQTALRTVTAAAKQAGAGTTVVIGPGVYREGGLRPIADGTEANPIVFHGDPTGALTESSPAPVVIDAGGRSTGFNLAGRSHIRLESLAVTGARWAAMWVQNSVGVEIRECQIYSNRGAGLALVRPRGANSIINNLIYANSGEGIQIRLRRVRDSTVRLASNTVYGNGGRGIWIDRSSGQRWQGRVLVAHNLVQNNRGDLVVTPRQWNALDVLPNVLSQEAVGVAAAALTIAPPVFVDPAGPDGRLGGAGSADDDFRVDTFAGVVDGGAHAAATWALDGRTVRHDHVPDEGAIDLGFHYPN
jgi:parallel beta-helix repeat protein